MPRRRAVFAVLALPVFAVPPAAAREVHGAADAYAEPGLALAFAVLRGRDEAGTTVVIRIEADPTRYGHVSVQGRDPFGAAERVLLPRSATAGLPDLALPRPHFAELPRTEFRFEGARERVVYYLGVPDTTPEFDRADALSADLARRIARARAALPGAGR